LPNFKILSCEIFEIEASGYISIEKVKLDISDVLLYGTISDGNDDIDIFIQDYNLGKTNIVIHGDNLMLNLDLSKINIPENWINHSFFISSVEEKQSMKLNIFNVDKIWEYDRRLSFDLYKYN
jgi:hypothetical protein